MDHSDMNNHGHSHSHHSEAERRAIRNRIQKAAGHLNAVGQMVADGRDCTEILTQLAAVKSAIANIAVAVMKSHIEHCLVHAVEEGDLEAVAELNAAIERFMRTK